MCISLANFTICYIQSLIYYVYKCVNLLVIISTSYNYIKLFINIFVFFCQFSIRSIKAKYCISIAVLYAFTMSY